MSVGIIEQMLHKGMRLKTRLYTLLIGSQFRELGAGARIAPPFRFYGLNQIALGEKVFIARDCWIHIVGGHEESVAKIIIKAHAGIGMGATISAARQIVIEENVLLARNVYISDHAHAYKDIRIPVLSQGIDGIAPVLIGRNSWLGQNVVVLPGVTIGQHCIIGANSVVNQSIPDYCIAVGAPARVVKRCNLETGNWEKVKSV